MPVKRLIALLAVLLFCATAWAGDVQLAWDASISSQVTGYKIYAGNASGIYSLTFDAGDVLAYTVTGLVDGTWYFAATAHDASGVESAFSNEISTTVGTGTPPTIPSPPTNLTATPK